MSPKPPKPAERSVALTGARAADARVAEHVIGLAALRVGQDLVGLVDLLEARVGIRIGVDVRMPALGELAERALDVVIARVARDAQDLVEVTGRGHSDRV